jgi:hypothetical protein
MRIGYDDRTINSAFGSNVVANNNVEILRGSAFNTSTYLNPNNEVRDETNHSLGIPVSIDYTTVPLNRVLLTTSPQILLTIRIKIKTSGKTMDILYEDVSITSNLSYFTASASALWTSTSSFYSSTNYQGSNSDESAIPIITNFNNNVPAGRGEELTITGRYFGTGMGSDGSVIFKNADHNAYPTEDINAGIDHFDVISWNDNEIQIQIPAVIDSITKDIDKIDFRAVPGTGYFKVRNRYGYEKESSTELEIPYAVLQGIEYDFFDNMNKYNPELIGSGDNSGYIVRIHQDVISTYPQAKKVIEKALKEWTCVTGVNWKLGLDISTPVDFGDGVCQVDIINDPSDPALMITYGDKDPCGTVFPRQHSLASFDIVINSAYQYDFDTLGNVDNNKYDFYQLFLHELGHAHVLDHANREDVDLMYFSSDKGLTQFADRLTLKKSTDAQTGGDYVTSHLVGPVSGCSGQHILAYPKFCKKTTGVFDRSLDIQNITVYPNPISSTNELKIDLSNSQISGEVTFIVYDSYGREVQISSKTMIGNKLYRIRLEELTSGMYYLNVSSGSVRASVVFVK